MTSAKKRPASKKTARRPGAKAAATPLKAETKGKTRSRPAKKSFKIPAILLEGDDPPLLEPEPTTASRAPLAWAQDPDLSTATGSPVGQIVPPAEEGLPKAEVHPSVLVEAPPAVAPLPELPTALPPPPPLVSPEPAVDAVIATAQPPSTRHNSGTKAAAPALPEAYGTGRLLLLARDTHWLYAHWDFTREQLALHNAASPSGHLLLRVHKSPSLAPDQEIALLSDSTHWFVPVDQAGTRYVADLGWYSPGKVWHAVAASNTATTPPERVSEQTQVQFATIPSGVSLGKVQNPIPSNAAGISADFSPVEAEPEQPAEPSPTPAPFVLRQEACPWFSEREEALARLVSLAKPRLRALGVPAPSSRVLSDPLPRSIPSLPSSDGGLANPSSFADPPPTPPACGFWLNVNAELVVYGATEPDASVEIGGRIVRLAPDGSFNLRFALPDGDYDLPIAAVSADGLDTREARLRFSRHSIYQGSVGTHPQVSHLKKPAPEKIV